MPVKIHGFFEIDIHEMEISDNIFGKYLSCQYKSSITSDSSYDACAFNAPNKYHRWPLFLIHILCDRISDLSIAGIYYIANQRAIFTNLHSVH